MKRDSPVYFVLVLNCTEVQMWAADRSYPRIAALDREIQQGMEKRKKEKIAELLPISYCINTGRAPHIKKMKRGGGGEYLGQLSFFNTL